MAASKQTAKQRNTQASKQTKKQSYKQTSKSTNKQQQQQYMPLSYSSNPSQLVGVIVVLAAITDKKTNVRLITPATITTIHNNRNRNKIPASTIRYETLHPHKVKKIPKKRPIVNNNYLISPN